jgi:hypothetical protein
VEPPRAGLDQAISGLPSEGSVFYVEHESCAGTGRQANTGVGGAGTGEGWSTAGSPGHVAARCCGFHVEHSVYREPCTQG